MSTRSKIPWLLSMIVALMFGVALIPVYFSEPYDSYVSPEAEAGMHRNASGQIVCAHLNSSTGADHTTGTVTVSYHNNTSFTSDGTATHNASGVWCYTLSQAATNYDISKILWTSTGAITVLQSYPTTGYSDNGTTVPANVTHVGGTTQTAGDIVGYLSSSTYGLAALHTDNTNQTSGSTPVYAVTDEGKRIAAAVDVAAVGVHEEYLPQYHTSSSVTVGDATGQFSAGDITNLGLLNASTVTIGETSSGAGIDAQLLFTGMESVDIPSEVHVWGYYAGSANHWVSLQAWNYRSGSWEYLNPNNSANGMPNANSISLYRFPLHQQHFDGSNTLVRFLHQGGATGSHTGLVLDKVSCDFIYTEAPPSVGDIDTELSTKHGTGPWTK